MLGVAEEIAPAAGAAVPSKRKQLQSNAMKRTSEWIFSQELPSDLTVHVGVTAFSLHQFPLLSKCGYIRTLLSEASDTNCPLLKISDFPGGAETFELVSKFCYGINFEISTENIATLRCAAEYLGMTEDYSVGNLVSRTEVFLEEVALVSLSGAVTVLHKSEVLLPLSEQVKLVSRCIDAIAYLACKGNQFYLSLRTDTNSEESLNSASNTQPRAIVDWWAEELMVLRIDTFQRVLMAMEARGIKQHALGPVFMLYAQKSLRGLDIFGRGRKKIEPKQEHEKRVVLETIVSLLPREKNATSVSFLSLLLRAALYLETTVACWLNLERRIALQLEQAVLDDLLIPSFSFNDDTIYDVNTVHRILMNYLDSEDYGSRSDDEYVSPPPGMEQVGKLMENYLAEIASDPNLTISSFISLAELVPEQAKITEDGMYRAIDIYLKAHPSLSDMERKKVCSVMDCQKLSREACAHAAQSDRLPVQIVVQVLYYEQQRLRDSMAGSFGGESPAQSHKTTSSFGGESPAQYHKTTSHGMGCQNQMDELSQLRRQNDDLKLELVKTQMQLKEQQKPSQNSTKNSEKPPLPKKSIINSMSKKLGRLNPFTRADGVNPFGGKVRTKPPKNRRHSIS